jgi:hypothetical protein
MRMRMTVEDQGPVIPYDILDTALSDYRITSLCPPLTYGEWQLVQFPEAMTQEEDIYSRDIVWNGDFIFRNVESDYYYRANVFHDMEKISRKNPPTIRRVERKMVPVYVDL